MRSKVLSTSLGLVCISLLSLPLMANADTYTVFGISGVDSQRSSDLFLGDPGCNAPVCPTYVPGTFSGTALVDVSTDAITAATITTFGGDVSYFTGTFNTPAITNLPSGLTLDYSEGPFPYPPYLSLTFNLASDTAIGSVSGCGCGSGESEANANYTLNMVGTLKPELTTTIPPTAAPEIDPASAASSLTMLVGGLLVLRGRRPRRLAA